MLEIVKMFNLKRLSEVTGVSHNTLKNYSCGRLKELKDTDRIQIENYLNKIGGNK